MKAKISENDEIEVKLKEIHDKKHILTLLTLDKDKDKQEIKEENESQMNRNKRVSKRRVYK